MGGGVALSSNLLLKLICAPVLVVDCGRGANAVLYHTLMPVLDCSDAVVSAFHVPYSHCNHSHCFKY